MNEPKLKLPIRWRYLKTILLALAATAALIWSAIHTFDVDSSEIFGYLWLSLALLLIIVLLSVVGAGLLVMLRKWRD